MSAEGTMRMADAGGGGWQPQIWDLMVGAGGGSIIGFVIRVFTFGRANGKREAQVDNEIRRLSDEVAKLRGDIDKILDDIKEHVTKADLRRLEDLITSLGDRLDSRLDRMLLPR